MKPGRPLLILLIACMLGPVTARADDPSETPTGAAERRTERGPVNALVRVEPETVRIGDALTLTIEVTAEAGVELLMPVFGASLERFKILEFVPRERIDEAGRTVSTQSYRLQPPASGPQTIPAITIEFVDRRPGQRPAPEDQDAFELLTERVAFTVESVVPQGAGNDLKPPLGALDALSADRAPRWPWLVIGAGLAILAGALLLVRRRLGSDARQRSAHEIALERLVALEARPRPDTDADAMNSFFVELSDIVRHYLEDRFGLHAPELTTEEFLEVASGSPDLTRDHRNFLQSFLRSADRVKFARHVPASTEVETSLSAVRDFFQQTAGGESPTASNAAPNGRGAAHA